MYRFATALSVLLLALPVLAGDSGAGSDGPLNCETLGLILPCSDTCIEASPCEVQIGLISAITADPGDWETTPHEAGVGVYDPGEWAVIYQYTTIDIPEFVTITFVNHPKGAPVVWLATENVNIAGTVELNGTDGSQTEAASYAIPGPGGFSGGNGGLGGSAGFGPGGGGFGSGFGPAGGGGGYGCSGAPGSGGLGGVMYGTPSIVPLIGGSGGGAFLFNNAVGGGAGGGAILIASSGSIVLPGEISANGGGGFSGGGAGSGGGIRLIANVMISGSGRLQALGGTAGNDGGCGRIRLEAPDVDLTNLDIMPTPSVPGEPGSVFPGTPEAPAPILRVASLTVTPMIEKSVPTDPQATVATDDVAFAAASGVAVTINIEALNFPEGEGMIVNVRIVQADGGESFNFDSSTTLEDPDGDGILTAIAGFFFGDFDPGKWEVQLTVLLP